MVLTDGTKVKFSPSAITKLSNTMYCVLIEDTHFKVFLGYLNQYSYQVDSSSLRVLQKTSNQLMRVIYFLLPFIIVYLK